MKQAIPVRPSVGHPLASGVRGAALAVALCLGGCAPSGDTGGGTDTGGSSGAGSGGSHATGSGGQAGSASGGSSGAAGSGGSSSGSGGGGPATGGDSGNAGGATGTGGATATGGATGEGGTGGGTGTPDAGGGDTPATGGNGCEGTKFCEDWEKQTAGQAPTGPFTIQKGGYATITVDTSKKYSGKQSLHFHMTNSPNDALMHLNFSGAPLFPFAGEDIHGRVMLFLSRNPSRHWDLTTAFAAGTVDDESQGEQFSLSGSSPDNHVMSVHQPGDKSVDSSDLWPLNKWICVQWEFAAGATSRIQIKFDGKFIDKGMNASMAAWKPPGFKSMFFGWKNFEGGINGDMDFWADDLAYGEKEIPCPPAMP